MKKERLIEELEAYLREELAAVQAQAHSEGQSNGPNEKRTAAVVELERQLLMYRFLPKREALPDDPIAPGALVELELCGEGTDEEPPGGSANQGSQKTPRSFCLIVPSGGGLILSVDGQPVQVVTPQSPLGEALLGHRKSDVITVKTRRYRILGLT
jgi:transcription elongation GreA/GreB family factor